MVGRPREFDPEIALNAAMEAFWAKGYEATSLADLMEATGLHKGSLYQAFGDKHTLFIQALKRYLSDMRRMKNDTIAQAATPLDGMRAVTHGMIDMADGDCTCPKGCLAINTLVELAPHDAEVQGVLDDHMKRMREGFAEAVARGQEAGQIRTDRTPQEITGLMMTFMLGLGTNLRGRLSKEAAHQLLDAQFDAVI
jgi:TetR/AcrR family transcriptional regulator, transcriptional repressor for nem operon